MRAVVQRAARASVAVDGREVGAIGRGLLVLVAVMEGDAQEDMEYMVKKLRGLRIFEDGEGKMNLSVADVGGAMLIVSQFTLAGDARRGNRPSFSASAEPGYARDMYDRLCDSVAQTGTPVARGVFGADMQVELVNDGPVTILLDSGRLF